MVLNLENFKNFKKLGCEEYLLLKTKFVYNTIHLDYSELSFDNVFMLAEEGRIDGILKFQDILCTVNCLELFDYIIDTIDKPITEDYIKNCHEVLTKHSEIEKVYNLAGKFKENYCIRKNFYETKKTNYNIIENELIKSINHIDFTNTFEAVVRFHANFDTIKPFEYYSYRISQFLHFKLCLMHNLDIIIFNFHSVDYYNKLLRTNLDFIINYNELYNLFEYLKNKTEYILKEIGFVDKNYLSLSSKIGTDSIENNNKEIANLTLQLAHEITSNINNISKFLPNN